MRARHAEALRILAPLTGTVLRNYRGVELSHPVRQFIASAKRPVLQTILVEIVGRLHELDRRDETRA